MKQTTPRYQKTAVNELKALLASSEDLLESIGDQSGEAAEKLRERLTASVAKTKQRLENSADAASSAAQDAADSAQSLTQKPVDRARHRYRRRTGDRGPSHLWSWKAISPGRHERRNSCGTEARSVWRGRVSP